MSSTWRGKWKELNWHGEKRLVPWYPTTIERWHAWALTDCSDRPTWRTWHHMAHPSCRRRKVGHRRHTHRQG